MALTRARLPNPAPIPVLPRRQWRRALVFCGALLAAGVLPGPGWAEPRRGDVNGDDRLDITDAINLLSHLFLGTFTPPCDPVADANDDGLHDISDPVRIVVLLFLSGPPLPELSPEEIEECKPNEPPVIPPRPVYRTYPDRPAELGIGATDPEGDALRYEPLDLPAGADLDASGLVRWTPGADQLGPFYLRFAVLDGAVPANRVEGSVVFQVLALDGCARPRCDPALGCEPDLVPLPEDCCGEPAARVAEPDMGCPEGLLLHVGRNQVTAPTIGRLQNCDSFQVIPLGQGGHIGRLNVEVRCIDVELVDIYARLETTSGVELADGRLLDVFFEPTGNGYYEARGMRLPVEGSFTEGQEAELAIRAVIAGVVVQERKVRIAITLSMLPDLP